MTMIENQYKPDFVTHPGLTLIETLESLGLSQVDLAERTGRTKKHINELVQGKAQITPDMALELERVLGVPAEFWNNREQAYQQYLTLKREENRLSEYGEWLDQFPVKNMIERGWIARRESKVALMQEVLSFFGIARPEQWDSSYGRKVVSYRKSNKHEASKEAVSVWLRAGEIDAQRLYCQPYDEKLFREVLSEIRALTIEIPEFFVPKLRELCASAGVAVCFTKELQKAPISGAARWLSPSKALIQLSLRYKRNDQLWFSFFHEAGHVLLHKKKDIFLEYGSHDVDGEEKEADQFACNMLIPPSEFRRFLERGDYSHRSINEFAKKIGIHPGIVVGRLQHDEILPYSRFNDLIMKLEWA